MTPSTGTQTSDSDTPKQAYHHGDVPECLLDAVEAIIDERGVAGVSLREAARRIGVSHAAPAHHFGDKQGLLTAFAAEGFRRLVAAMRGALDTVPDAEPDVRLKAVGLAYVRFAIANRAHFEVMFRQDLCDMEDPGLDAVAGEAFGLLGAVLLEWQEHGWVSADQLPSLTTLAWSIVHGFATLWLEGPLAQKIQHDDPDEVIEGALALFNDSLRARAQA